MDEPPWATAGWDAWAAALLAAMAADLDRGLRAGGAGKSAVRVLVAPAHEAERQLVRPGLRDEPEPYKPAAVQFEEQSFVAAGQQARFLPGAARALLALALREPGARLAPEVVRLGVAAQPAQPGLALSVLRVVR